jgi:uncharacterized membrane protein YgcG
MSEKLSRENCILWKAQFLAVVRDARLYEFLDGTLKAPDEKIQVAQPDKTMKEEVNLAYAAWYVQDQQLLSFLLNSVTKEVLGQIIAETSAAGAWSAILGLFASQSRARIVHLRSKLASTCKGDLTCATYYALMKGYADEMVVARKRLDDEEVICYILVGLDVDFDPFVKAFTVKTEAQTLNDLSPQLLMDEACVESQNEQQQISVNAAFQGGRGGRGGFRGGCTDGGGFRGGRGDDRGGGCKIPCEVCGKTCNLALRC